ncbi:MAG: sulfite exporter TauE/SafE family protein [Thermoplasmata archaeon]|nr:sulfite exporter TauE/SafE family protein [Thermoplasmata archaeon]
MEILILLGLIALGAGAGVMGALFGLGGGVIFVPVLMLAFGMAPAEAAAVSLVGIVAGSVGASSVFVEKGLANIRLGLMLEVTTTIGAVAGALIAGYLQEWLLSLIFCAVMIYSGIRMILSPERVVEPNGNGGKMCFEYKDEASGECISYHVQNAGTGSLACVFAGMMSSMTGVGGGAIKVPVMNLIMHVPMKAASSTSSYMIGITAFSGAITYFFSGQLDLTFAGGVAIGAFIGALLGTYLARKLDTKYIRRYFSVVLFFMATLVLLRVGGIL